jgi:hypothetical protein
LKNKHADKEEDRKRKVNVSVGSQQKMVRKLVFAS